MADLGCDYDDDPNSSMAYEAGIADGQAAMSSSAVAALEELVKLARTNAYADGIAEERARWEALTWNIDGWRIEGMRIVDMDKGMRRAAKYAAEAHESQAYAVRGRSRSGQRWAQVYAKAAMKCERLSRGEPAFATSRAFGRGT